jgi:hypothetical protein
MQVSFPWLIDPVEPDAFFSDYYERKPLLIERREPSRFVELLSIAAVDRFLATASPCHPEVFLVDAARKLMLVRAPDQGRAAGQPEPGPPAGGGSTPGAIGAHADLAGHACRALAGGSTRASRGRA